MLGQLENKSKTLAEREQALSVQPQQAIKMKQELELEAQRKQFELEQKFAEEAKNKEAELNAQ